MPGRISSTPSKFSIKLQDGVSPIDIKTSSKYSFVISFNLEDEKIIIYGGGVHFSKQYIELNGSKIFGQIVGLGSNGWENEIPGACLTSVSQEHGTVKCGNKDFIDKISPGDLIGVIPVHACLAVNLLRDIYFV